MREEKRAILQNRLKESRTYRLLRRLSVYMDKYYIDAIMGFALPGGLGDILSALVSVVYILFSMFVLRSLPLTLAIVNNTLCDIIVGMVPFHVGDVLDIFHNSYQQNMTLIEGFVEGDKKVIRSVNRKAWLSAIIMLLLVGVIVGMVFLLIYLGQWLVSFSETCTNALKVIV